jgi:predicted nucleotidyltransferase component of viral defense system
MKMYDQRRILQSEAAQLLILQGVFSLKESNAVIFQGGTAIRWFYGGMRFSEDLDFVTAFSGEQVKSLLKAMTEPLRRQFAVHFGPGEFLIKVRKTPATSFRTFIDYISPSGRKHASVKIEFEKLKAGSQPDMKRAIMQSTPSISTFLTEGILKIPGFTSIIQVETPEEMLSDKLRALLERPYTKGRDFFDVWFLINTLRVKPDAAMLKRKLDMYEAPFSISVPMSFYTEQSTHSQEQKSRLVHEIDADLNRFINPDTLKVFKANAFGELIDSVRGAFRKIEEANVIDFDSYPLKLSRKP